MPQSEELNNHCHVSVVLPVYNEEGNLTPLCDELFAVLDKGEFANRYEIVCCDDGSSDGSLNELKRLADAHPQIRIVELRRNYGQTAAIAAGVDHARGDCVVLMDADRQNDPADIPRLLAELDAGWDVVSGWRYDRKEPFFSRRLPSRVANWLIARVGGVDVHDFGCTLKAYRREFLEEVSLYGDMHRFIPVLARSAGARVTELKVNHRPRVQGQSKYGIGRTYRVILDIFLLLLLGTYRTRPVHFFGGFGMVMASAGFVCGAWVLVEKYCFDVWAHKNPLLLLAVFLFSTGLNLLMLGLLAELITRTYFESQEKTIYHIRATYGGPSNGANGGA